MSFETVPWFVGGQLAEHTPETARSLPYAAALGEEGVLGHAHLTVRALDTPDAAVTVDAGACVITCRASGGDYQGYVVRNKDLETVPVAVNSSGTDRSDLLVVRVENPFLAGEPYAVPPDEANGPYVFFRVIPGVPSTTTRLQDVAGHDTDSGIALARIDIPAGSTSITDAMIVDLRTMPLTKSTRKVQVVSPADPTDALISTPIEFATVTVNVPTWATKALVTVHASGLAVVTADATGGVRARLDTLVTGWTPFDLDYPATTPGAKAHLVAAGELAVPAALRGTAQDLVFEGRITAGAGGLRADANSLIVLDVEFQEAPGD